MRTRPAHGGYPGGVVVRRSRELPPGQEAALGLLRVGEALITGEALRVLSIEEVARRTGCSIEDLVWLADGPLAALDLWPDVRYRTHH